MNVHARVSADRQSDNIEVLLFMLRVSAGNKTRAIV